MILTINAKFPKNLAGTFKHDISNWWILQVRMKV